MKKKNQVTLCVCLLSECHMFLSPVMFLRNCPLRWQFRRVRCTNRKALIPGLNEGIGGARYRPQAAIRPISDLQQNMSLGSSPVTKRGRVKAAQRRQKMLLRKCFSVLDSQWRIKTSG
ncbi:hypothetical protein XENOCAPTIV_005749 [Xenoophorus captivus]|uniref:Uncharacterized protein n=1 Tax=Xenoophorus captivus TaxID=1517983 RepID=A0ABV0RK44_9TELE